MATLTQTEKRSRLASMKCGGIEVFAATILIAFGIHCPSEAEVFNRIDGRASSPNDFRFDNSRFWSPAGAPREGDIANINLDHNIPLLRNTESLAGLNMSNGARIRTNEQVLTVRDGLGKVSLSGSRLTVTPNMNRSEPETPFPTGNPGVDATRLELASTSTLRMDNGFVRLSGDDAVGGGKLVMDTTSLVHGNGTIIINGGGNAIENRGGRILASGGLLRIDSESGQFSLTDQSVLDAKDGVSELRLDAPLADNGAFDGKMNINGGNRIALQGHVGIESASEVNLGNNTSDGGVLGSGAGRLFAHTIDNRGTMNLQNGIVSTGRFNQFAGASLLVEGDDASDIIAQTIDLNGLVTVHGELILDGNTTVRSGAVVNGTGVLSFAQGHEYKARSDEGMSFEVPVVNNGILSPGVPCFLAGCDTVSLEFSSLDLSASSVLELSIASTDVADFDRIVSGDLSLDGTLAVTMTQGFIPSVGDRFHLMDGNSTTGTFARLTVTPSDPDDFNIYEVVYEGNDVFLDVLATDRHDLIDGDFDDDGTLGATDLDLLSAAVGSGDRTFDLTFDGVVDSADREMWVEGLKGSFFGDADLNQAVEFGDFLQLSSAFGRQGGWADGDFDGNGVVAFADFLMLSSNFGQKSAASVASVPEPTISMLALFGLIGLVGAGRRKR